MWAGEVITGGTARTSRVFRTAVRPIGVGFVALVSSWFSLARVLPLRCLPRHQLPGQLLSALILVCGLLHMLWSRRGI